MVLLRIGLFLLAVFVLTLCTIQGRETFQSYIGNLTQDVQPEIDGIPHSPFLSPFSSFLLPPSLLPLSQIHCLTFILSHLLSISFLHSSSSYLCTSSFPHSLVFALVPSLFPSLSFSPALPSFPLINTHSLVIFSVIDSFLVEIVSEINEIRDDLVANYSTVSNISNEVRNLFFVSCLMFLCTRFVLNGMRI